MTDRDVSGQEVEDSPVDVLEKYDPRPSPSPLFFRFQMRWTWGDPVGPVVCAEQGGNPESLYSEEDGGDGRNIEKEC